MSITKLQLHPCHGNGNYFFDLLGHIFLPDRHAVGYDPTGTVHIRPGKEKEARSVDEVVGGVLASVQW